MSRASALKRLSFARYNPHGLREALAAFHVAKNGMLSDFIAKPGDKFLGGKYVQLFENRWSEYHMCDYSVSYNSATSALVAALSAVGVRRGDEVLVVAYSMCISATAPLFLGAIPIFVDIESDYFCLDPSQVEQAITPKTKAILSVDLFGQSADLHALKELCGKYNLKLVSDSSHTPGCSYLGYFAPNFCDIAVYSLNQHKIIHTGEGGVASTNSDEFAYKLQLLRNHAEASITPDSDFGPMLGGNFRFTELQAAIGIEQLKRLPRLIARRKNRAEAITAVFSRQETLIPPKIRPGSDHVYYLYPLLYRSGHGDGQLRSHFVAKLKDQGLEMHKFGVGYIKPLYKEDIFQNLSQYLRAPEMIDQETKYKSTSLPNTERLYNDEMLVFSFHQPPLSIADCKHVASVILDAVNA